MKIWKSFKMALFDAILSMFFDGKDLETMDVVYATLIQEGYKTIDNVKPESMKKKVCDILLVLGLPELVPPEFGGTMGKKAV